MKKVLIIVHLERATPRVEGLIRFIHEFGWQPVILTGATSKHFDLPAEIVETPYRNALGLIGRLLNIGAESNGESPRTGRFEVTPSKSMPDLLFTLGSSLINYPCPDKNWKPFALRAGRDLLKSGKIDAIISTSAPLIGHIIASRLKTEYGIPWIADFRDLWSQNHSYRYGPIRRLMDRRLELKTMRNVDVMTTPSEPWAEKLRTLHKGKMVYAITHGFNPAWINIPPAKLTSKFTITYTGAIYPGKQNPLKLFAALRNLITDETIDPNDIEIRFYGHKYSWLDKEIKEFGLADIVKQYGLVPGNVARDKQKESQLLLVFKWEDAQERGWYPGKIFEYLGSRRPIITIGGSDDINTVLLNETKAGISPATIEDIYEALKEQYAEYKLNGAVSFKGDELKMDKYTHREMAKTFSEILTRLIQK